MVLLFWELCVFFFLFYSFFNWTRTNEKDTTAWIRDPPKNRPFSSQILWLRIYVKVVILMSLGTIQLKELFYSGLFWTILDYPGLSVLIRYAYFITYILKSFSIGCYTYVTKNSGCYVTFFLISLSLATPPPIFPNQASSHLSFIVTFRLDINPQSKI